MKKFIKIGPTAFGQAYFRTFYDIPYAKEIAKITDAKNNALKAVYGRFFLIPQFEARYKGTEKIIKKYIKEKNINQMLELASGISPQGLIYTKKYPKLTYLETDLAYMIRCKKSLIKKILREQRIPRNLHFAPANCLDLKALKKSLGVFKPQKPLIIFNIGLLSYLDTEEKRKLARNITSILSKFGGVWITPDPSFHNERRKGMYTNTLQQREFEKKIAQKTGTSYEQKSFANEKGADKFFTACGFKIRKYPQIGGYKLSSLRRINIEKKTKMQIMKNIRRYGKVWVLSL